MDEQFDFRALLLKLQDCLSDNDRRRLHFIVGDTIPRQLRDNPTLGGTLDLLESLFDQAKISEQDFDFLIQAFREIHCHEGVKRLKEYQLVKHARRGAFVVENSSNIELDRIAVSRVYSSLEISAQQQPTSTPIDGQSIDLANRPPVLTAPVNSEKKIVNVNFTFIRQTLKSRLTLCQLSLFLLNIVGITIFLAVIISLRRHSCDRREFSSENILIIREGTVHGDEKGGQPFDDSFTTPLSLNDKLVGVKASWSFDTLTSITFIYSNGAKSARGAGDRTRSSTLFGGITLTARERFTGITLYRGLRNIDNPYKPNGTLIIVGLRFSTSENRTSELFGSANGTEYNETFPGYQLAYVKGRSQSFMDALQFVWFKYFTQRMTTPISKAMH